MKVLFKDCAHFIYISRVLEKCLAISLASALRAGYGKHTYTLGIIS